MAERLTADERRKAEELLEKQGRVVDLTSEALSFADAVSLAMLVLELERSYAVEHVTIARGLVPGDLIGGHDEVDHAE